MKKIICLILLMLIMSGCNNKENSNYQDKTNKENQNTKIDNKKYICKEKEDDDYELIFHYENDILKSYDFSYWYDEEYLEEVKELAIEYENVTYKEIKGESLSGGTFNRLLVSVDLTKNGLTLQNSFGMFLNITDSSWNTIEKIVTEEGYACTLDDEEDNSTYVDNEAKEIVYTLEIDKAYEDKNNTYKGKSLNKITLKKNNVVLSSSCGINAGCSDYRGTYKIDGNTLTIILKEFDSLGIGEWEQLPSKEQRPTKYEIIGNNTFKFNNELYILKN